MLVCDGYRVYSVDAKRWDAHARRELLELGNRLWERLGADAIVVFLSDAALDRKGFTTTGIYYEVDGNVASGDCDTIQKNCVSNLPIGVAALIRAAMTGEAFSKALHSVGRRVGVAYEFVSEGGVVIGDFESYHDLEFCSCYPVLTADGQWAASGKLGRVIVRFGLCQPGHRPDVMLRSKALSLKAEAAHSTLLTLWADRAYASAGPGRLAESGEDPHVRRRYTELATDADFSIDDEYERALIIARYGCTRDQLALEIHEVWDEFDRTGRIEFSTPWLMAAVIRDN